MKTLTFNREVNDTPFLSCKNFGQLISWIESEGAKENLYIAKIILNERLLDEDEENLLHAMSIDDVKEVRVEVMGIHRLVSMTLMSVIQLLQDLQLKSMQMAEVVSLKHNTDQTGVKQIFANCKTLIDSLEEVFALHINEKFNLKHFSLWREAEKELSNILQLILQAYQMGNHSFLSELLGVAFPDALQQWEEVLEKEVLDNAALSQIFNLNSPHAKGDNEVDA